MKTAAGAAARAAAAAPNRPNPVSLALFQGRLPILDLENRTTQTINAVTLASNCGPQPRPRHARRRQHPDSGSQPDG